MRTSFSRRQVVPAGIASIIALTLAFAFVTYNPEQATAQGSVTIDVVDFAFNPGSVTVEVGTTVTWVNNGAAPHTATSDSGAFDTGTLQPGQSGSVTFDTPGTYSYFCAIHPNMVGTIVVVAAEGGDDMAAGETAAASDTSGGDTGTGAATQMPSTGTGLPGGNAMSAQIALAAFGVLVLALGVAVRKRVA